MRRRKLDVLAITRMSIGRRSAPQRSRMPSSADWRAGLERAILAGMAYEYRVTEAEDGTFPVELWSSKGGREQLVYKTPGFQTRAAGGGLDCPGGCRISRPCSTPRARDLSQAATLTCGDRQQA